MRLSDSLQSFQCWDELVNQCQAELKFANEIRDYFVQRKKLEEEYAEQVRRLDAQFTRQANLIQSSYCRSTWVRVLEQSTEASACMLQGAQTFEKEILPAISALTDRKKQCISDLITRKQRLQSQISLVGKDIQKLRSSIEDFAKATETNKTRYEESVRNKLPPDTTEKYKTRFISNAAKLQEYNNDYNLLLNVVTMHESSYVEHIIPAWLDYHQGVLATQLIDIKSLLRSSFEVLLHQDNGFVMAMSKIYSIVSKINFESEYAGFVGGHGECPALSSAGMEYDGSLQTLTSLHLPSKQLIVNDLTHTTLTTKLDTHRHDLSCIDSKLDTKSRKLGEIEAKTDEDGMVELKKLEIKAQVHELNAQRCRYQMTANMLSESLAPWNDVPLPTFYKLLPLTIDSTKGNTVNLTESMILPQCLGSISPSISKKNNTLVKLRNLLSLGRSTPEPTLPTKDTVNLGTPVSLKWEEDEEKDYVLMTREDTGSSGSGSLEEQTDQDMTSRVLLDTESTDPIEHQPWFYTDVSRQETAELLQLKGQFLVRKTIDSKRRTAVLVLSVHAGVGAGVKHFIMQINDQGQFRLEGAWFRSIPELLNYHITTGKVITGKTPVVITQPVLRDRWNLHHSDIRLKEFLGKGNFGDVYQALLLTNGKEVAVKTCRDPEAFREKFLEEADILKKFHHANVVKLLGVCSDELPYYIVMEYMNNGSLLSVLQEGPPHTIKQMVHYCEQAAAGMAYLHSQNYIHRDLAARNCLVRNQTVLKISDFGMTRYQERNSIYISKMKQIPIRWTAPECLTFRTYTFKSDIWSYGILMWEIFNKGEYPYQHMSNADVKDQIDAGYRLPKTRDTPPNIYQIMFGCWSYEPRSRPSFEEVHQQVKTIYIESYAGTLLPSNRLTSISSNSSFSSRHNT